ncbi:MAG: ABC transporter permease [Bacteroidetes bacterium]|nr:ABC transporter permease [Bacteroidota bacterium]
MIEVFIEIWESLRKNKLRTFLTGFSVAWGIFMLIILLGSGNGLKNAALSAFGNQTVNSMKLYSGYTSIPYAGYEKDRRINLTINDIDILKNEFSEIDLISATGYYSGKTLKYKTLTSSLSINGTMPNGIILDKKTIIEGRFINNQDISKRRKVIVIDETTKKNIIKEETAVGKKIQIDGVTFLIVGVYESFQEGMQDDCYIPLTLGNLIFNSNSPYINNISFSVNGINTTKASEDFEKKIRTRIAKEHNYSPEDSNGVWIRNNIDDYKTMMMVMNGIALFVWIIGLGTLLAGVVGVSNIMLVTIKERTNEFGIRKALGAKPSSIIRLILIESIVVTSFFGYVGLVLGIGVMEIFNSILVSGATTDEFTMFKNPTVNLGIAVSATLVLIISGLIAGYAPAKKAARLKTIDAMRYNK